MNAHTGMIMDFGEVKKKFREFLDTNYDHHLLLNPTDPLITFMGDNDPHYRGLLNNWGVTVTDGRDPTVENFASIIYEWAKKTWTDDWFKFNVKVYEAATNCASYGDFELSGYQGQEPREAR
jgi:6-pyruvoyl-tetrahydropterin synthase